jgi:hypothetical protein
VGQHPDHLGATTTTGGWVHARSGLLSGFHWPPIRASSKSELFEQSLNDLNDARARFQQLPEYDIRTAQVCDVDSLMARTYLSQGDLQNAQRRLAQASLLTLDALPKTKYDCMILTDELEAAYSIHGGAWGADPTSHLDSVIDATDGAGYETNEIRARALFARAKINWWLAMDSDRDCSEAHEIYERLRNQNAAAEVSLWRLQRDGDIDDELHRMLSPHSPDVQLRAYGMYVDLYGSPTSSAAMNRRRDAEDPRWLMILDRARAESAINAEDYT